jgi:hypothetical protein
MSLEDKINFIRGEIEDLEHLRGQLDKVMSIYYDINWPYNIQEPHHVSMELERVYADVESRIDKIHEKLGSI